MLLKSAVNFCSGQNKVAAREREGRRVRTPIPKNQGSYTILTVDHCFLNIWWLLGTVWFCPVKWWFTSLRCFWLVSLQLFWRLAS